MKKASEIVRLYHSYTEEVNHKRQIRRICNELSRAIEACATKDFRCMGYQIHQTFYKEVAKELKDNGYRIMNEVQNPTSLIISFEIHW